MLCRPYLMPCRIADEASWAAFQCQWRTLAMLVATTGIPLTCSRRILALTC